MTETAGIHFGPAWLRDTLVQPPHGLEPNSAGGGGGGSKMASNPNIMAPAKLAEFRYGREEMLALFTMPGEKALPGFQERVVANAGLLAEKPLLPMNLMGPMSEEEQRAWQKGANSDTSLRLYKKELPPGGLGAGGPGIGRGGGGERGRGRGRGFFDRHRAPGDEEDPGRREEGGRGFGRGGMRGTYDRSLSDRGSWFDRSQQGQPTEEGGPPNGNISPRKGYTRAPFDDWRKPTATAGGDEQEQEAGGGWRSGPSSSGRRWNAPPGGGEGGRGGWRTVSDDRTRYNNTGDREYQNGSSSRWHRESNEEPYNRGGGRGGFSGGRGGFSRGRSRQDSDIPEWASEDISNAADLSGGFDASGKFSSGLDNKPKRVINLNRDLRGNGVENEKNEDEAFEDEEVDVDDLPENARKEPPMEVQLPPPSKNSQVVHEVPPAVVQPNEQVMDNKVQQDLHDQMTNDFVSKLIEDDEPHMKSEPQAPTSPPQATANAGPPPSQALPPLKPEPGTEQIPSVQQIQWFYLDPQGNEQGPFTSSDMLEWYEARYFPADLMLRRAGIDRRFTPLNEICRLYGRVPFTPGHAPGPLLPEPQQPLSTPTPPPPQQQPSPSENSNQQTILQHMQQQMLQQQLMRQQQQLIAIQQQTHLSDLEKAQLINKVMQLSILPQQQQQKPSSSSSAGDISMLLKQHEQQQGPTPNQQQQMHHHQQQDNHHHQQQQQQQQQQQMMQQQQHKQQQQFGNFNMGMKQMEQQQQHQVMQQQQHHGMQPIMNSSSAESGLQLLGNLNGPTANEDAPFNPIKSLLRQLQEQDQQPQPPPSESMPSPQQESHHSESPRQDQPRAPSNISGFMNQESPSPPPLQHQSPQAPRSIWGDQKSANQQIEQKKNTSNSSGGGLGVWGEETARESPNSFYNQVQQQREVGINNESSPADQDIDQDGSSGFVKPRASEKKDKKAKKAEEKKRAREKEAKRNAGSGNDYIPGMEGSVRPSNDSEEENTQQRQYEEEPLDIQQQEPSMPSSQQPHQPQFQPKLAPWAKMSEGNTYNGNQSSGLSLTEIQKLEEEREREAKMRREMQEAAQARARQEEEARRPQNVGMNWANTMNSMDGGAQKSLAEIQAEEARQDRERQERERREKKARQKDLSLAQASVWGSASSNLSWANKTSSVSNFQQVLQQQPAAPPQQAVLQPSHSSSSIGFWDNNDPPPAPKPQPQQAPPPQQQQKQPSQHNNKKNMKNKKEETKVAAIFKEKGKPKNEFDEWCITALEKLDPQVDIPTFLGFLIEVESPYEVNDYVKNYIGDGKGPKNFAKEYIERRSKWKNSLKSVRSNEDELLKPAAAINPNEPEDFVPVVGGGGAGGGKKNKKKNKSKSKLDASHLLGFSVAAADRPNAGELDLPQ